jgi:hypothetical protein
MFRRLATYPIALASATAYAVINLAVDVHGAADVALFAICGLAGAAIAVPLALSGTPERTRRRRASRAL